MSRLRVRIELNRRLAGVPLDKMASVVEETRKFFHLLSEDVEIETDHGEWVATDFDAESLNFTAEYAAPVSAERVQAFGAAFAGATSLRRTTIAQFTRIAEFLGEDELVGFGLFQSDQDDEPTEWRCLSKRDALRFGEEIRLLAEAAGEQMPETHLPAVMNGSVAGRRLFKDRREELRREREALAADPSKFLHEMETNLSRRIAALEGEMAAQTRKMQQISGNPQLAEERFQKLLSAMEGFWTQGARTGTPLLAAPATDDQKPANGAEQAEPAPALAKAATAPQARGWSMLGVVIAAGIAILLGLAFPDLQQQWARFASVEILPLVKPKPPEPPALPVNPAARNKTARPLVQSVAARSSEPFNGPLIPLDVPPQLKRKIQSEVQVDVVVAIDPEGNVTGAHVSSTKGNSADLLVAEALRAARESRFRPARAGRRSVESQMLLTFLFKPESDEF